MAQGGDWGAIVTDVMATQGHPELLGIHSNMPGVFPPDIDKAALGGAPAPSDLSADEKLAYEQLASSSTPRASATATKWGCGPQAIYGIADSPSALPVISSITTRGAWR